MQSFAALSRSAHASAMRLSAFAAGDEGLIDPVDYVMLTGKTHWESSIAAAPSSDRRTRGVSPHAAGVSDRVELDRQLIEQVKQTFRVLSQPRPSSASVATESLAVAEQFHEQGIPVIGVPKTIDNDLSATAFSFGFDSAVACATDVDRPALFDGDQSRTGDGRGGDGTTCRLDRIALRHRGRCGSYPNPGKFPGTFENVCQKVLERDREGKRFTELLSSPKGAHLPGRHHLCYPRMTRCMATAKSNWAVLSATSSRPRSTSAQPRGALRRARAPTMRRPADELRPHALDPPMDPHAVRLVLKERFGEMVAYHPPDIENVPIKDAVGRLSNVSPHCSAIQAGRALGVCFGEHASPTGCWKRLIWR